MNMSIEDKPYKFLGIYKKMPDWMKQLITNPFSFLPREKYLGGHYKAFYELAVQMEKAIPEQVEESQYLKIKQVIEDAYKYVPYYREIWNEHEINLNSIQSFDDFQNYF